VSVSATAEPTHECVRDLTDGLAKKYVGAHESPRSRGEQRLTIRINPQEVDSSGF
jgi:hypothetical protein